MTLHAWKLTNWKPRQRAILFACSLATWAGVMGATQAADAIDFNKQIRPIFKERCYDCHGPKKGPAIVPGDSSSGLLLKYVQSEDAERVMPAKGDRLTRKQIEMLKKWIEEGAKWPEEPRLIP